MSAQVNIEFSKKSILDLLKLGNKPLLLTLDEAQNIKDVHRLSPELIDKTKNVLDEIHNGSFNRPLILVVSGLNMTRNILQSLGISRFNNKCSFNLSALDQTSEKAIIADWLIKDVQA
ncbi:MAG: hypothetical protein OXE55_05170 [Flavobacteriaceae bacterium]|nr:hypothetical protein [Flavobacteriaceae bacterium]MCY4254304.1 hypothetical protein [Flavobacteriaceae bacterium]